MDAKRLNELKELLETIRPKCGTPLHKTHPIVVLEELLAEVERQQEILNSYRKEFKALTPKTIIDGMKKANEEEQPKRS
jgi:hypothetical protein